MILTIAILFVFAWHQALGQPTPQVIDGIALSSQDVIAAVNGRRTLPRYPAGWVGCERFCPPVEMNPICDSWGQTQPNNCTFDVVQCRVRSMTLSIGFAHQGRCPTDNVYSVFSNLADATGMSGGIITNPETQPFIAKMFGAYTLPGASSDSGRNKPLMDYVQIPSSTGCERVCPALVEIVCDNEGRVYSNRCYFEVAYCHAQRETRRFLGTVPCQSGVPGNFLSSTMLSDSTGNTRRTADFSSPVNILQAGVGGGIFNWGLVCPVRCPNNYDPVCNNLGIQFTNFCFFRMGSCYLQSTIGLTVYRAPCGTVSGNSACQQSCPLTEFNPICDQNGLQYTNDCFYRIAQCFVMEKGLDLMQTACSNGLRDATMENCDKLCPNTRSSAPYCDNEGNQYQNFCYFSVAQCKAKAIGKNLLVTLCGAVNTNSQSFSQPDIFSNSLNFGSAGSFDNSNRNIVVNSGFTGSDYCNNQEDCGSRGYQPVCDSQGTTHINECYFRKVQCNRQRVGGLLTIASYTQCGSPSPNDSLFPPMPVAQAQMGFNPDLRGIFAPNLRDTNPQFVTGGTQGSCKSVRNVSGISCSKCEPPANSFTCGSGSNCVCGTNCVTYCSQCDLDRDSCQLGNVGTGALATVCSRQCEYCNLCRPSAGR